MTERPQFVPASRLYDVLEGKRVSYDWPSEHKSQEGFR